MFGVNEPFARALIGLFDWVFLSLKVTAYRILLILAPWHQTRIQYSVTMWFEKLSRSDFDARRRDGELALTLIGMSNVGKSHWSGRLEQEAEFKRVSIDERIEAELVSVLQNAGLSGGIEDVAKWMGQPYEEQSAANQQIYLDLETMEMQQMIDKLKYSPLRGNTVVDTTGSVVHINRRVAKKIGKYSTIVYLQATADMQQEMFEKYIAEPKPVIWGDVFKPIQGESEEESRARLAQLYPELLARRSKLYKRLAHVAIPHDVSLGLETTDDFLEYVREGLPRRYLFSSSYAAA